jgi:hypothetical protein
MGRKQRIANTSDKLNINTAEASIVLLLLVSGRYYGVLIEEADSNRAWSMQVNPCDVGFESPSPEDVWILFYQQCNATAATEYGA